MTDPSHFKYNIIKNRNKTVFLTYNNIVVLEQKYFIVSAFFSQYNDKKG